MSHRNALLLSVCAALLVGGCSTNGGVAKKEASAPSVTATGSRIPISPEVQGHRYAKSPHDVSMYSESDIRQLGQPDLQSFLNRRGLLR